MNNLKKLYIIALSSIALAQGSLYAAAEPISSYDELGFDQAAQDGDVDSINDLLALETDVNMKNKIGQAPLHIAACYGQIKVMQLLIKKGADLNLPDENGKTPLHYAAYYGQTEVMQLLIKRNANLNSQDKSGKTPLFYAAQQGYNGAIKMLLDIPLIKDNINQQDQYGRTPLHYAAMNGNACAVHALLSANANIYICDNDNMPPIFYSTKNMHNTITTELKNVAIEKSSIDKALLENNIEQLSRLLSNYGLNPNRRGTGGRAPLHEAVICGVSQAIPVLIAAGAYVNSQTEALETPLDLAILHGKHDCVQCLLQAKEIEVNLQDSLGNTPLHRAIRNDDLTSVQLLLNTLRIDLAIKNDYLAYSVISTTQRGMTALDLARLNKRNKIIQLLDNYATYKIILSLLEAQHPRLGAASIAHNLDTNCIRNIYEWLTKLAKNR